MCSLPIFPMVRSYKIIVQYQNGNWQWVQCLCIVRTRDLFNKIGNIKGIFHARMSTIKDRNNIDLTEVDEIKKSWQKYTKELYKKALYDPDNHAGVITHLECEVKWALGSITKNKARGGDGIPAEVFQVLKDDAVEVLHSISPHLENSAVATGLEKASSHSNPKGGQCQRVFKPWQSCTHFTC